MKKKTRYAIIISVVFALLGVMVVGAISANTVFVAKEKKPGFVEFNYTMKDNYASIEEIDIALKEVTVAYKQNIAECSDEYVDKQSAKCQKIIKELLEKKAELAKSLNITLGPTKLDLFNQRLNFWSDEYSWRNRKYSQQDEKTKQAREKVAENYNKSVEIKKLYDEGKLTLDEAYDQLMAIDMQVRKDH